MQTEIEPIIKAELCTTMNPEVKAFWLDELLSGIYPQGTRQLRQYDAFIERERFCCLGVLGDLAVRHGVPGMFWDKGWLVEPSGDMSSACLTRVVANWAGFTKEPGARAIGYMPFRERDGGYANLADANDAGCTFPQIADLIRYFF